MAHFKSNASCKINGTKFMFLKTSKKAANCFSLQNNPFENIFENIYLKAQF